MPHAQPLQGQTSSGLYDRLPPARGWVEFWLCWIAVDLVGVPELPHSRYYPSAILYAIYAAFVIWGFFVWLRISRQEQPPRLDQPAMETVG